MLTFERPVFAYVNICNKITPEIQFIYLGNMEMYCIFKTSCVISCLFSTKCCLFHNFIFFYSNNIFFINHVLKFKYLPHSIKVNILRRIRHYSHHCFSINIPYFLAIKNKEELMPHNGICMINICSELELQCLCVQLGEIAILIFLLTTHKTHHHIFHWGHVWRNMVFIM